MLLAALASSGCDAVLRFATVTYHPDAPPDSPPPDAPLTCPTSYLADSQTLTQYRHVTTSATFDVAMADCADDETGLGITGHTHLAVLSSTMEAQVLAGMDAGSWVGLTDHRDGMTWRWVTAETSLDPSANDRSLWAPGEPNNPGVEDCAHFSLGTVGPLNNVNCTTEMHGYFCECDGYPNDPNAY